MAKEVDESEKLNGVTIDGAIKELSAAYKLQQTKEGALIDPNSERARRISSDVQGIESVVKGVLGNNVRATKDQAYKIVSDLAYALAQAEGYTGKPGELSDERKASYLANAASATGNPVIGNTSELTQNIMDMASAKPGDPLYDSNSSIAQLINYIATRKDEKSARITYLNQLVVSAWQHPDKGLKLQKALNEGFGFKLAPHASANESLGEVRNFGTRQTQEYVAKIPKTYQKAA